MKISILIGNGFDLNLGLKTSYKSFLKYYLENNKGKQNKILESMRNDLELWSDFELELGNICKNYDEKELNEYLNNCEAVLDSLNKYLKQENSKIKPINFLNSNKFVRCFINIKKKLTAIEFKKIYNLQFKAPFECNFFNFNYTDSLYYALGSTYEGKESVMYGEPEFSYSLIQMHGDLDENMIVGFDNKTQVKNKTFSESKDLAEFLIKKNYMEYYGIKKFENYQQAIKESDFIIVYGMSLGETDKRYWLEIINALIKNEKLYVLIIVKDDKYLPHMPSSITSKALINEYTDKFLKHKNDLTIDQIKNLKSRIIISMRCDIF